MKKSLEIQEKHFEEILELARTITSTFAWDEILESIVKKAAELIPGVDIGTIWIYDSEEGLLKPEYGWGVASAFRKIMLRPGESVSGKVFASRVPTLFRTPTEVADVMTDLQEHNRRYYNQVVPGNPGFQSSLCAPLIWKDECLGVLSLHNIFSPIRFTEENLRTLEYVATHAAVALANSRLYEQQRTNVAKLERSVHVHEKLTQMVLNGDGLDKIAAELAGMLSQSISVYIFDTLLDCAAKIISHDQQMDELPILSEEEIQLICKRRRPVKLEKTIPGIDHLIGTSISAGKSILGYLIVGVRNPNKMDLELRTTIERASMVIALEMMKKKVEYETEQRMKVDLFEEVLHGSITKETLRKFSFVGYDPSKYYFCMVCSFVPSTREMNKLWDERSHQILEKFSKKHPGLITFLKSNNFVIFYPMDRSQGSPEEPFKVIYNHVKNFVDKLCKAIGSSIQVGVGRQVHNIKDIHISFKEAKQTLVLLRKYGGDDQIWTYRSLGPLRFILEVAGEDALQKYMEEVLGPLLGKYSKLLETLVAWFSNERQIKRTSEVLSVHINTISYRLNQVEKLLNVSLRDEDDLLTIQIALRLWQTLHFKTNS